MAARDGTRIGAVSNSGAAGMCGLRPNARRRHRHAARTRGKLAAAPFLSHAWHDAGARLAVRWQSGKNARFSA
jgi:hypothetical protein